MMLLDFSKNYWELAREGHVTKTSCFSGFSCLTTIGDTKLPLTISLFSSEMFFLFWRLVEIVRRELLSFQIELSFARKSFQQEKGVLAVRYKGNEPFTNLDRIYTLLASFVNNSVPKFSSTN